MRKQYILLVIAFLLSIGASAQPEVFSGKMHVTPLGLEQKGDSVYIKLDFDISGINIDSRKSISLIPVLVAPNNQFHFPEVTIKGRINYNVHRREMALMNKRQKEAYEKNTPYAVLEGFKSGSSKKLDYNFAIKYEPWMADAKLDIYEDLCGCGYLPRRMGVSQLVNLVSIEKIKVLEAYAVIPNLAYIKPEVEEIKRREIIKEAYLDFVVNQTQIRPDYMNNSTELKKITDLIQEIKSDPNINVKEISVAGYASPEGTMANNQRLSENRAKSLVEFLFPQFSYPRSIYSVTFGGENWIGLKQQVESSDMPYRQQVLEIIESVPAEINYVTDTSRKKSLMNLKGGEPYRYMLREFFPSLRKAVCKIDFEVKNFDVDQAKEIIKTQPQKLSLNEMFLVASTYDKGSQDFIDLFETAVKLYPSDTTATLNAASAALERKDQASAERYLQKIEGKVSISEYYNAMGVLYMLKGELDNAEGYLNQAASMGLDEAKQNIKEIAMKRENIRQIESHKSAGRN